MNLLKWFKREPKLYGRLPPPVTFRTKLRATISATVRRADGTVEELGVISSEQVSVPTSWWRKLING